MHLKSRLTLVTLLAVPLFAAPPKSKPTSGSQRNTAKVLDKKLADFGITPRSLGTWKVTGGRPSLEFLEISFHKVARPNPETWQLPVDPKAFVADGFTLNGFEVMGSPFLEGKPDNRPLVLLRLNKQAPQASKDAGRTWIDGEKLGEAWVFAFDNGTLKVTPADEVFTPTTFKAMALERGAVTRTDRGSVSYQAPYFHSAVLAVAQGKGEVQGLIKFPGTSFVVPFRGIRHQDRWVARALGTQSFHGPVFVGTGGSNPNPGMGPLDTSGRQFPQIEFTDARLQIGVGSFIDYAQDGDTAGQLRCALEFDMNRAVPLEELAKAYQANLTRSLWTRSDEDGSFSREAERAYVKSGLAVWFFAPRRETGFEQGGGRTLNPMLERLKSLGAKVEFIKP